MHYWYEIRNRDPIILALVGLEDVVDESIFFRALWQASFVLPPSDPQLKISPTARKGRAFLENVDSALTRKRSLRKVKWKGYLYKDAA